MNSPGVWFVPCLGLTVTYMSLVVCSYWIPVILKNRLCGAALRVGLCGNGQDEDEGF